MPTYVIRSQHSANECPSANAKVREVVVKGAPQIPEVAAKLGVKVVIGPLILGSEHESVAVVESATIEKVVEFVEQAGMGQWNSVRVSPAQTMQEALGALQSMPPPIY